MKYKLINKTTGEEHICSKETVNDFDYYIGDVVTDIEHSHVWCKTETKFHPYLPFIGNTNYAIEEFEKGNFLKVIATNNPDKKIPKVIDEVEMWISETTCTLKDKHTIKTSKICLKAGYNKSQETHPYSDDDMIEFAEFFYREAYNWELEDWKKQRIKTIYYE